MAGIGFELKKLYRNDRGVIFNLKAVLYTSAVTVGPQLICMFMITMLQIILELLGVSFKERELFLASTVYAFIFSQIITSGFSMVITRYVSDMMYMGKYEKIKASLYGIIALTILVGGVIGAIFIFPSKLNSTVKLVSYLLYMELIIMWIETVYLSTLKDYLKVLKSFLAGCLTGVILGWMLLSYNIFNPSLALLIAVTVGIFIIITFLMFYIQSFFKTCDKKYFEFLQYMDKYRLLFLTCLFYTVALYAHNFVFWGTELATVVANTYVYAPVYDVPTFYAFLTILPATVIFVVSVETSFYDKYKEYYSLITNGGSLRDIVRTKEKMVRLLWQEIFHLMEIQLFFTLIFLIIGNYVLPFVGISQTSVEIFAVLSLGAYCNIMLLIVILLQLYFENRRGAFIIAAVFLGTNVIFTITSYEFGLNYYGLGYFTSAFISLVLGLITLSRLLNNIDYITFCGQPIIYKEKKGIFTHIVEKLY